MKENGIMAFMSSEVPRHLTPACAADKTHVAKHMWPCHVHFKEAQLNF